LLSHRMLPQELVAAVELASSGRSSPEHHLRSRPDRSRHSSMHVPPLVPTVVSNLSEGLGRPRRRPLHAASEIMRPRLSGHKLMAFKRQPC
jgi:hypothetical protein